MADRGIAYHFSVPPLKGHHAVFRQAAGADQFSSQVRVLVAKGTHDQAAVARRFGVSVATLRRRLEEEGNTFRSLRIEALHAEADDLLRTDLPLATVAERLGFSDARSFSRAFKSWSGLTPNARRKEVLL